MKEITKKYDINAHITNLRWQLFPEADSVTAHIAFDNLGCGQITAIKLAAKGYNSFGDVILVNGKESYCIVIQDIFVEKNASFPGIRVKLPHRDIRKLDLEEYQVCLSGGAVLTYQGKNIQEFTLSEFSVMSYEDRQELEALRDVFDHRVTYDLLETEQGWVCTCGRFNPPTDALCSLCKHSKEAVRQNLSPEGRQQAIAAKKDLDAKRQAANEIVMQQTLQRNKYLFFGLCAVLLVVLIAVFANSCDKNSTSPQSSANTTISSTYSSKPAYKAPVYESMYTALNISNVKVTSNSSYTVCTGTVTNNGKSTYTFVKVKGSFKNSAGKVIDTDWTYAVGSEGLAPGESTTFRMSVSKDYSITKCTVTIYD